MLGSLRPPSPAPPLRRGLCRRRKILSLFLPSVRLPRFSPVKVFLTVFIGIRLARKGRAFHLDWLAPEGVFSRVKAGNNPR